MNFRDFNLYNFLLSMSALMICFTIHEFAHAYSALRCGDDTAKRAGRVSLNPIDHLDPMGTVMMIISSLSGFGLGWGKPVPVNTYNLRRPRWDNLWVSLWGPLSNLLTAIVVGVTLRFVDGHISMSVARFLYDIVLISIGLAVFNMIPISPLDGSHILSSLLPYEKARAYDLFMGRYGLMVLLLLVFIGSNAQFDVLGMIVGVPSYFLSRLILGY